MTSWAIFWLSLGVVALGGEGYALFRKAPGDTLSEQIWNWLKVVPGDTHAKAALQSWRSVAVGGTLIWLFGHFLFGWWT